MTIRERVSAMAMAAMLIGAATTMWAPAAEAQDAQEDTEQAEISDSHLAAARDAIDAINATDQFDQILPNAATQIKSELIPNNPDREEMISTMVDETALDLASRRAALENEVARAYAQIFSESELQEISAFYNSEAGQKLLQSGPRVTQESMAAAEVWRNGIMRDLRQQSLQRLRESTAGEGQGGQNGGGGQ